MTGWFMTTERYNGDLATLKVEHIYHLTAQRPDLALPPGYRFDTTSGVDDIWFDPEVTAEGQ